MGLENYITDPGNHKKAHIRTHNDLNNSNGLVVATHPLKTFKNQGKIFISPTYGLDMNVGITLSTIENIHDGTDNLYWTASSIVPPIGSKFTFNSGDQNHTGGGTSSIKVDNVSVDDTMQLLSPVDFDLNGSVLLSIWVYVEKDWVIGDSVEIFAWDSGTGMKVGTSVFLEDYFTFSLFSVWQNISIPLTDMNLTTQTIDAFKIRQVAAVEKAPKFYMDDIKLEGTVGEVEIGEFFVKPDAGTWYYVQNLRFIIAAPLTGKVENGTMPGLSYDDILGVGPLVTGIVYQRLQFGEIKSSFIARQLSDFLSTPGTTFQTISDGVNTMITIDQSFEIPVLLKSENQDELKITIIDNLAGLSLFRMFVSGYKEERKL